MFNYFLLLTYLYSYLSHGLYVQGTIDDQTSQEGDVVKNSTSAVGTVKVEIQDENGSTLHGFALDDCHEMFADEIEGPVAWQGGGDVSSLAGKPERLRFWLNDADIYAFKFNQS